ncbi:MAG: beta-carboxysome assembly chaperone CcmS [Limnospira sp.]
MTSNTPTPVDENRWQSQLDRFVENHQQELAALAWGIHREGENEDAILGIDLKQTPRFVSCPRSAIEILNRNTQNKLQEILGIIDGYKPEEEVLMIGIGSNTIKLVYFQTELTPPECFERINVDTNTLIGQLEEKMAGAIGISEAV